MDVNRIRTGGFTLLEVLIVMGVLGILLSIGIPSYSQYRQSILFRDAIQAVSQELGLASSKSLRANTPQQVTFTLGITANGKIELAPASSSATVTTTTLPGETYIASVMQGSTPLSPAQIVFNGRGRPIGLSQPINITLRLRDRTAIVRLLPSGKVTLP